MCNVVILYERCVDTPSQSVLCCSPAPASAQNLMAAPAHVQTSPSPSTTSSTSSSLQTSPDLHQQPRQSHLYTSWPVVTSLSLNLTKHSGGEEIVERVERVVPLPGLWPPWSKVCWTRGQPSNTTQQD